MEEGVGDVVDCKKVDTDSDWLRCITNKCLVLMPAADSCKFSATTARPVWCLICVVGFVVGEVVRQVCSPPDGYHCSGQLLVSMRYEQVFGFAAVLLKFSAAAIGFVVGEVVRQVCSPLDGSHCSGKWMQICRGLQLLCFGVLGLLVKEETLVSGLQYYTYQATYAAQWGMFCFGFDAFLWCWSSRLL
ncbi:hypothetical protein L6452_32981 [Arctium lappa]|uniref:Uncharacterized protein n=1 Tax=Arctium lappa TaxID=4217 RepID=A0ACB8Z783_ARCLA|nr:hypothetical protein L6452_32981 [Arctium lappa]